MQFLCSKHLKGISLLLTSQLATPRQGNYIFAASQFASALQSLVIDILSDNCHAFCGQCLPDILYYENSAHKVTEAYSGKCASCERLLIL